MANKYDESAYMTNAQVSEIPLPKLDILMVGPSKAGKSTLVRAFALNE